MTIEGHLQGLGFSKYEARVYTTLVRQSPLTGYELASFSGVPRANVYTVLAKLEERHAVIKMMTGGRARYAAVSPTRLLARLRAKHNRAVDAARASIRSLEASTAPSETGVARGYAALEDLAVRAVRSSRSTLLVATTPNEAATLARPTASSERRGVEITTLCMAACAARCGGCRGSVYRYDMTSPGAPRPLMIVADGRTLVAADIAADGQTDVFTTKQPFAVEMASAFVRNSIALASIVGDLDQGLERDLRPATRKLLRALGPRPGEGLLQYIEGLIPSSQRAIT